MLGRTELHTDQLQPHQAGLCMGKYSDSSFSMSAWEYDAPTIFEGDSFCLLYDVFPQSTQPTKKLQSRTSMSNLGSGREVVDAAPDLPLQKGDIELVR